MKRRVGVSLRSQTDANHGEIRDALSRDWTVLFNRLGIWPILVPNNLDDVGEFLSEMNISALLLSNGNNVCDWKDGEPLAGPDSDPARDKTEAKMIEYAIEKKIPVFGVCRGSQFLNSYFGGSLTRALKEKTGETHVAPSHSIKIVDDAFRKLLGCNRMETNSFHNQGFTSNQLAASLRAFAVTEADVVEGFSHRELPILGIQWHPERVGPSTEKDGLLMRYWLEMAQ